MKGLKHKLMPQELRRLLDRNLSLSKIAQMYGVTRQRMHQVYCEYKELYPELFSEAKSLPSKEEIEGYLARNMPLSKIAQSFGISQSRLRKLMQKYSLKKELIKDRLTADELKRLYVESEMSDGEIAAMYGCSKNTVMKLRYTYGIYEFMRPKLEQKLPKELFEELYVKQELSLAQIAEIFGTNIVNVMELKKKYGIAKKRAKGVTQDELEAVKKTLFEKGVIKRV